jgi:hypothetical protein
MPSPTATPRPAPPALVPARLLALLLAVLLALLLAAPRAQGADRLLGTGGVTEVEGSAGGGVVPWALVAGLGTDAQLGGTASCTSVRPAHFRLDACGAALGLDDRVELSAARWRFDLGQIVPGQQIREEVFGLKWRLAGDALFAPQAWMPQLALGVQYKRNLDFDAVPKALGAQRASSVDVYVAATRVWLDGPLHRSWLADLTVRSTEANQFGLLGFGGDRGSRHLEPEASAGLFVSDHLIAGLEYRHKPDNLSVFREARAWDAFLAWLPHKQLALTLAYADLGPIADHSQERGPYLSLQGSW